jgi:hypothetical protein
MNSAAQPLERLAVGVVVERHKAASKWIDYTWKPVDILPDEPEASPWTVLRESDGVTAYYAGGAVIELYRSETARYRENLESGSPCRAGAYAGIDRGRSHSLHQRTPR